MKSRVRDLLLGLALASAALHAQDVQMNQPDNNSESRDNATTQSETSHAVTPGAIVAAWNDSHQFATLGSMFNSLMSWGYSASGSSFTDAGLYTPPSGWEALGDPAVVADSSGHFYVASLESDDGGFTITGVSVSESTNTSGSITLGPPVNLTPLTAGDGFDKELMAVDRSGGAFNGRVYLTLSEGSFFIPPAVKIVLAHSTSTSPSLTFSSWQALSPADALNHGAMPAVGPSGELYVAWGRFTFTGVSLTGETIEIVKSTDGGGSFGSPVTVATPTVTPSVLGSGTNATRTRGFPFVAVDSTPVGSPTRGNIYIVYQAHGAGSDNSDIFFTRSTNGGATWSQPRSINTGLAVTLNPDTTTHDNWQPSITVSPVNGHIYVTFFDRRDDPANVQTRVYRALSTDGGLTWSNAQLSASSFTPSTGYDPALVSNYFGDYNWAYADSAALHFTWGDSRKTCVPPAGAANPCSPSGRGDQDVYYHRVANLSGPDLFIQPWGAVTGIGPLWQTPDIFVVNATNNQVNAEKGVVNKLRARVRNLGNVAATNTTVRFKYAPWFAGVTPAMFKQIGTVNISLSAAGGGSDTTVAAINWDLTNLSDNNGGIWPSPISAFDHFCVLVSVEYPPDVNLSNNVAQNNFFDVSTSTGASALKFLIASHIPEIADAHLEISKLPSAFNAALNVEKLAPQEEALTNFRLQPNEVRSATLQLARPKTFQANQDVVADISVVINGKISGGISLLLYKAAGPSPDLEGLPPAKGPFLTEVKRLEEIKPAEQVAVERPLPPRQETEAPMRTIPAKVQFRQTFSQNFETTYKSLLSILAERKEAIALADLDRGLINTKPVKVDNATLRKLITPQDAEKIDEAEGHYLVSVWLQNVNGKTEVGVDTLVFADDLRDVPIGHRVHSNGTLEKSYLSLLSTKMK